MTNDKKTIGITSENERVLAGLQRSGYFASEIEAARFAFAVAARQNIAPGNVEGVNTKWNVGTVDYPDQSLRSLVEALYPEEDEPYRLIEYLINRGLNLVDKGENVPPDVYGLMFSGT